MLLDIGCGLRDTTVRLASLVGPTGHAHGVDVAERMIETAIEEAAAAGVDNVSFAACDVEVTSFDRTFDYDVPRCGPGPFSMANADTVTDVLVHAGYEDIGLARQDLPYEIGNDLEHTWVVTARAPS